MDMEVKRNLCEFFLTTTGINDRNRGNVFLRLGGGFFDVPGNGVCMSLNF